MFTDDRETELHPSLLAMRKSILPEYNQNPLIVKIDGFIDKIRELDPKDKFDLAHIKYGYKYEATVSYPHSLGELGNQTDFVYETKPTAEGIAKDLLDTYRDVKKEINKELVFGIIAKSGRDENIEKAIDKVLMSNA